MRDGGGGRGLRRCCQRHACDDATKAPERVRERAMQTQVDDAMDPSQSEMAPCDTHTHKAKDSQEKKQRDPSALATHVQTRVHLLSTHVGVRACRSGKSEKKMRELRSSR